MASSLIVRPGPQDGYSRKSFLPGCALAFPVPAPSCSMIMRGLVRQGVILRRELPKSGFRISLGSFSGFGLRSSPENAPNAWGMLLFGKGRAEIMSWDAFDSLLFSVWGIFCRFSGSCSFYQLISLKSKISGSFQSVLYFFVPAGVPMSQSGRLPNHRDWEINYGLSAPASAPFFCCCELFSLFPKQFRSLRFRLVFGHTPAVYQTAFLPKAAALGRNTGLPAPASALFCYG